MTAFTPLLVVAHFCFLAGFATGESLARGDGGFFHPSSNNTLCNSLIRPAGYPCMEYTLQTEDGYLLAVQRVGSRYGVLKGNSGPPILLLHGLFMAGDTWFLNCPEQSLGFILADEGFDVWVGNVRGTLWGYGHVLFSKTDQEFWNWSWQDMAQYDFVKMLQHVYSTTNSKVSVIGHSQGTIISLAALTQPSVSELVNAAALLCPISYLNHVTAPLVRRMVDVHLDQMVLGMGIHKLNFRSENLIKLVDSLCDDGHIKCNDMLSAFTGKNCCFNNSRVNLYLEYEPHPSSVKNIRHLFQMIRKGTFSKYDYGIIRNLMVYGQMKPPAFDLSRIPKSLPLWMGYGGNDTLADVADVNHTLKELSSEPETLFLEEYGHADFIVSTRGNKDVYRNIIRFFKSINPSSSF